MRRQVDAGVEDLLIRIGSVRLGRFRLSSGRESYVYVDLRIVPFHPDVFKAILERMAPLVERIRADAVAGVATGGIPWSTGLGLLLSMPSTYVRAREKGYGTSRKVEAPVEGKRVVVVDDVATTGSSIAGAVETLRSEGATVEDAVVVVERGIEAREMLGAMGVRLHSVTSLRAVVGRLAALQGYSPELVRMAMIEAGISDGLEG